MLKGLKKAAYVGISSLLLGGLIPSYGNTKIKKINVTKEWKPSQEYSIAEKINESSAGSLSNYNIENINRDRNQLKFEVLETKYNLITETYNVEQKADYQEVEKYKEKEISVGGGVAGAAGGAFIGYVVGTVIAYYETENKEFESDQEETEAAWKIIPTYIGIGAVLGIPSAYIFSKGEYKEELTGATRTETVDRRTETRQRKDLVYSNYPAKNIPVKIESYWFTTPETVNSGKDGSAQFSFKLPNNFYFENPEDALIIKELRKRGVQEIYIKSLTDIGTSERTATITLETLAEGAQNATETINIDGNEINCDMVAEISNIPCGPQ